LAVDRNHEAAHNNLGLLLGIQGRYEESLAEFKKCGSEAEANASLAYAMTQRGELDQAQKRYLYALQLDKSLRPAGSAVVQLLDRQQIAQQLASNRREEEMKAARPREAQPTPEALSQFGPQRFPDVEIITRDAPPRTAPYEVMPAAYQASVPGPATAGMVAPAVYLPPAPGYAPPGLPSTP
jgi:tetratricopeptide (TPR) repeat protein